MTLPISVDRLRENPKYHFLKFCEKEHDVALPLISKVTNKKLSLLGYHTSLSNIKALCGTIEMQPDIITKCYFDNCGLTDNVTSVLLKGMLALDYPMQFVTKNNEIGSQSLVQL
jgi:hypothetical protein